MARPSQREATREERAVAPRAVGCFLLLALLTIIAWWSARMESERVVRERFYFQATEASTAVRHRLQAYEQVLRGVSALFAIDSGLTRSDWATYVSKLDLTRHFPGIQAMAYSPKVEAAQLDAYVRRVRAEGFPDYAVKPAGARASYVPVTYIEPFDWRNMRAFGFDLMTEPVRRDALLRARDTGQPAATSRIVLKQETAQGVQNGFLMCTPLFPAGQVPATVELRRAQLQGYSCAVFRMRDLMQGILGATTQSRLRIEIFDSAVADAAHLMYDDGERAAPAMYADNNTFEFGGHTWALRITSRPAFEATLDTQKPLLILSGGLLVSVLFALVVWSSGRNRQRAWQIEAANHELQKNAQDLARAKLEAEAASHAKGEFLANVSHELRTPLTLILAPLEQLAAAASPPPDWRSHIERISRNALLLQNRVDDILDFSRAEAGKFDVHWEAVQLEVLLGPLLDDGAAVAAGAGLTLDWQIDPALGTVPVDPRHLEKILLNLLSNALKFTPEGGAIRVTVAPRGQDWYELAVADSGIGIPADRQSELFGRFHQIDTSSTRHYSGSGIGLALVKQLTELMGGAVGVESAAGEGARFFVRLPRTVAHAVDGPGLVVATSVRRAALRRARLADPARARPAPAPPEAPPAAGGKARILVVDDHGDMRAYIGALLHDSYGVTLAEDGLSAKALLQQQPFDLVLADVMMPGLDGLTLTAHIKADPALAKVPVILVTARGGSEASSAGLIGGADDYIAKPFSPSELQARVHAALRMARLQEQLREASRASSMALLASGILHNVGNLLCNVAVSAHVLQETLRRSETGRLEQLARFLAGLDPAAPLPEELPRFVEQLAQQLHNERDTLMAEANHVRNGAEHAAQIITVQQDFARPGRVMVELAAAATLLDTALALSDKRIAALGIRVERAYEADAAVQVDRYKVLQILLNLVANAADAVQSQAPGERCIMLGARREGGRVIMTVRDNGCGIGRQEQERLFSQGYSTKGGGHGYGLHLSALWASESGGVLRCASDGPGTGATFTLELPIPSSAAADAPAPAAALG